MRILLIEDDPRLNEALCCALRQEGYEVDACLNGQEGLYYMETGTADLVLLDRMLPGLSGEELLQTRRKAGDTTPVLMLTAMGTLTDRVTGLDLGADDYLTKPFNPVTLGAKVKALIRRSRGGLGGEGSVIAAGPFRYDTTTLRFYKNGVEIVLSSKENAMMKLFLDNVNRIFTNSSHPISSCCSLVCINIRSYCIATTSDVFLFCPCVSCCTLL